MNKTDFFKLLKKNKTGVVLAKTEIQHVQMKTKVKEVPVTTIFYKHFEDKSFVDTVLEVKKNTSDKKVDEGIYKYNKWIEDYKFHEKRTEYHFIKSKLRQMWLMSMERRYALKRDGYSCQKCGLKQSNKKGEEVRVEVHHIHERINWDDIIEYIRMKLLPDPDMLETVCYGCHKLEHKSEKK